MISGTLIVLVAILNCPSTLATDCGNPGVPQNAQFVNCEHSHKKLNFPEHTEVAYVCKNPHDVLLSQDYSLDDLTTENLFYVRRCVRGSWTGTLPTCAKQIQSANFTVSGEPVSSMSELGHFLRPLLGRHGPSPSKEIRKNRSTAKCLRPHESFWRINLTDPVMFSYFEVDFSVENSSIIFQLPSEMLQSIITNVSDARNCSLIKIKKSRLGDAPIGIFDANEESIDNYHDKAGHAGSYDSNVLFMVTLGYHCPLLKVPELNENVTMSTYLTVNASGFTEDTFGLCNARLFEVDHYKCGFPEKPSHSHSLHLSRRVGKIYTSSIKYECEKGFELISSQSYQSENGSICGIDGKFDPWTPYCKPELNCSMIEEPEDLQVYYKNTIYVQGEIVAIKGTAAHYTCKDGVLSGNSVLTCLENGQWSSSGRLPLCSSSTNQMQSPRFVLWLAIFLTFLTCLTCCSMASCMYFSSIEPKSQCDIDDGSPHLIQNARYEKVPQRHYESLKLDSSKDGVQGFNSGEAEYAVEAVSWVRQLRLANATSTATLVGAQQAADLAGCRLPVCYPLVDNVVYTSTDELNY